jgi:hypothetical protein
MADLDILNYPGSKLGSLTSAAPPVLKPTPKTSATSDLMAKIGAMPTPGGYIGPKETLASEQELLAQKSQATEELAKADIGVEKAKREEEAAKLDIDAQSKRELVESIRGLPQRSALEEGREKLKNNAFVPTKDTVQDIAGLFSLINVIGMAIGGGGKQNAQLAMHAMNGMAEGYQKGRSDLYRKQQIEFDKNFKAMQSAVQTLEKEYSEAVELEKTDKEAGRIARQVALAKQNSPILKALENKAGVARTLEMIKDVAKSTDTAVDRFNSLKKIEEDKNTAERRHRETLASQERMRLATLSAAQGRRDEKALQAVGPALRNIAEQYPEGTVNTLLGASPDDKKRVQGAFRAVEESESVADYVARNPGAVGAMAVVRNFLKMDAIASLQNPDETQARQQKELLVDDAIDKAQQSGQIRPDDAQAAKVLQKKLFGLALSDVQGSGQRGSVYLDKSFQNLYDQASRQDTLLKIIKERSEDNNRNLKTYKLNIEQHNNPEQFPLLESRSIDSYVQERTPKSDVPEKISDALKGRSDGTMAKSGGKTYVVNGGVVTEVKGQ